MNTAVITVTPSLKASATLQEEAARWAASIGAAFVLRRRRSHETLQKEYDNLLVYTTQGPEITTDRGRHRFHLNMAQLRLLHLQQGVPDHFLEALAATGPVRLLDCTCGFGADAVIASYALPAGSVVDALEASPLLAAVTGWGFAHFNHDDLAVTKALRRIHLQQGDYENYLRDRTAQPYDILYFDPMFSEPVESSCASRPLRPLMDHQLLTPALIRLAASKAARRIVIKGRRFDRLRRDFPGLRLVGGKYSRICYAVLESDSI